MSAHIAPRTRAAIVVVGSLNMDFIVRVPRLPVPGETSLGSHFQTVPGGKGANQACAAGRLAEHVDVRMLGRVGYDIFADQLRASLAAAGVDISGVAGTKSVPTGTAFIWVDDEGQNSIVVAPGANDVFTGRDLEGSRASFLGARYALFQLETPLGTVSAGLKLAQREGLRTMLDPAPAQLLSAELLASVDILTPNEAEACVLAGRTSASVGREEAPPLAATVLALGAKAVVLKLGESGCFYLDSERHFYSPGFRVDAVDTTAAGDTFNAALAIALTEEMAIEEALRFANAAAAISVTRVGAQVSAPFRKEVNLLLSESAGA